MVFAGIASSERQYRAQDALEAVGLSDRVHHRPNQLSVGQRQRVAIARAIIMQPSLLLADEPTGNLDTHSGQHIMELLESLNSKDLTMIVVTHDPNVARRAHRVIVLADGQIVKRVQGEELSTGSKPFF